ncbi:2-oxo acid dehydrogenase subunit E2 [Leisingera sp. S232]|uniref:2-oxo acid dehydrogenase subunit E2 n=1 Tax=Leisingera sp. S232 TaxID=3415132 RepID=UPI003C7D2748
MTTKATPEPKVVPLRGARAMIADKMVASLQTAAQLTHHARVDMTALLAAKARYKSEGIALSVEDLLMDAVVQTLKSHPDINGTVQDREVHLSQAIDLGIAIALPGNLLAAPAIFGAGDMDLQELRAARRDLSERARTNKLTVPEMTRGTFTVSNLGLSRVEQFTPIINTPQIAILGVGRTVETAVRDGDEIAWKSFTGLSLTFDHRAIDGAPAADFLTGLCQTIEAFTP